MPKLTIIRGVSGSGKSTWARNQNAVVVSRDAIRLAQDVENYSDVDEGRVTALEDADVRFNLLAGRDVIVDDTNITWAYVKRLANVGYSCGASVEIKTFDLPLDQCIKNNDRRAAMGGRHVPHDVIQKQYDRFKANKNKTLDVVDELIPYERDTSKPTAVLVDIDGTLAHMRDRSPFDWKRVGEDDLDEIIAQVVQSFENTGHQIIIMSGRDRSCYDETEAWLVKHDIWFDRLIMRPPGDQRKDNIVKYELFNEKIRDNYNVLCVLDDRQQVVDMWRSIGLTCLQVAPGDF